jgi:hypothetical protein
MAAGAVNERHHRMLAQLGVLIRILVALVTASVARAVTTGFNVAIALILAVELFLLGASIGLKRWGSRL